jgi:AcrR family transcriptional regulator
VGIGTLYEFFPNKEAIVSILIERQLGAVLVQVARDIDISKALSGRAGIELFFRRIIGVVASDRDLYRTLFRTPELQNLAVTRRATAALFELARTSVGIPRVGKPDDLNLPHREADLWLISRMLHGTVLEIAFHDGADPDPDLLTTELVRLVSRMLLGRD